MMTKAQVDELASYFQIDQTTIFREYLQLQFLRYLYQQKKAEKVYFKGGTAIHLLFDSSRFSEDLDFSTVYKKMEIDELVEQVEKEITKELPEVKFFLIYHGKKSVRLRLKYQASEFKYPFVVRLDFTLEDKPFEKALSSPLLTKFPIIFPVVKHFSAREIQAEKTRAFMVRGKGRDIFDLWFLLEKKEISFDNDLIEKKFKEVDLVFKWDNLLEKIKNFPPEKLSRDLGKFLPISQRGIIKDLKRKLITALENLPKCPKCQSIRVTRITGPVGSGGETDLPKLSEFRFVCRNCKHRF